MQKETQVVKISYANWLSSRDKWRKIVESVKKGEEWGSGCKINSLFVLNSCGYCNMHMECYELGCAQCHLYHQNICYAGSGRIGEYVFWQFVDEMKKSLSADNQAVNWDHALALAQKILKAIEDDEPPKPE